jgi:hypothetical protein
MGANPHLTIAAPPALERTPLCDPKIVGILQVDLVLMLAVTLLPVV